MDFRKKKLDIFKPNPAALGVPEAPWTAFYGMLFSLPLGEKLDLGVSRSAQDQILEKIKDRKDALAQGVREFIEVTNRHAELGNVEFDPEPN